ncbi:fungal-specific transcription factor domain-containing protein [Morchella snyderi]|nr:fungal-specific transcription factor domain-containing protein [Morchella snyderi]
MISLKSKVELYESVLEQLKCHVDSAGQLAIQKALQGVSQVEFSGRVLLPAQNLQPLPLQPRDGGLEYHSAHQKNRDGESLVTAGVGSTGSVDHIREEPNRSDSAYPTGYMGKNSEVAWIQRVTQQLAREASADPPQSSALATRNDDEYQFETPTYHLDDLSVSIAGGQINPFYLPPKETADKLLNAFFSTVYPTFPIVLKKLFMAQYDAFFQSFFPPASSKRWLAMLNLMFAIGSLYGRLTNADWKKESEIEHLKYFSRGRVLSLDEGSILEVPDLQQVQVVGLAGIYLIASNQTNRAWNVVGLAIRYSQTLGLNLRNDVPELDEAEKEMRVRMWYSLYSLEYLLCIMTGRPSCIHERDCSVPMPRPIDEEQYPMEDGFDIALRKYSETASPHSQPPSAKPSAVSTGSSRTSISFLSSGTYPSTYFVEHTKLNHITAEVLSNLYSPATRSRSWSDIQGTISAMELKVMRWRADLPILLDFGKRQRDQLYYRQRMNLAFQYHYIRVIINRPCLCRLNYYRIPNESNRSRGFNRSAAATCIEAARETVALLPDEPNPVGLISSSPWWCLLHYLVSAGTILMVEMAMRAEHNPQQADGLLKDAKKVLRWLRAMAEDSLAAERSWKVLTKLLVISASKIGGDVSDVATDFPENRDVPGGIKAGNINNTNSGNGGNSSSDYPQQQNQPLESHNGNQAGEARPGANTEEFTDLFRGILSEPFPFSNIPIHTHYDDATAMQNVPHFTDSAVGPQQNFTPNQDHSANQDLLANHLQPLPDSSGMMFTNPTQMNGINVRNQPDPTEILQERRQRRRESQGVGNIALPPSYANHWVSVPPGDVGYSITPAFREPNQQTRDVAAEFEQRTN